MIDQRGVRCIAVLLTAVMSCNNPRILPTVTDHLPAARFDLSLAEGTVHRISQGEVLELTLVVSREAGFEAPITFSSTTPAGVVMVFRPAIVLKREDSEIRLVVDTTAERTLHRITMRGTDTAGATRDLVLELTVDAGP